METGLKELEAKKVALPMLLDRLHLACLTFQHEPKGQMRSKTNITGQKILASFKIFYQEKYFIHEISDEIKSYTGKKVLFRAPATRFNFSQGSKRVAGDANKTVFLF